VIITESMAKRLGDKNPVGARFDDDSDRTILVHGIGSLGLMLE
jgi:hypothetical protein